MHKLLNFVCDEMKDLEDKTDKGKLTMQDIQYADTLARLKKNLLKSEALMESDYSRDDYSYRRGRDSMGRYTSRDDGASRYYSRDGRDDLERKLMELKRNVGDEESKHMIDEWLKQMK